MFSRVTQLEIDTTRVSLADVLARFEAEVVPHLRELDGYEGVLALATPEGKAMLVSLWSSEEALQDAAGFATGALEQFATVFRAPPGREYYEVMFVELAGGVTAG